MKIAINAFSARLGGGQTYLKNILAHLPDTSDFEIIVFASPALILPKDPRIKHMHTKWPTDNPLLRAFWEKFVFPNVLKRIGANVLFCPGGLLTTRTPSGCLTVTMFRNMIPFDERARRAVPWGLQRLRNMLLRSLMLKSMASADLTIFISEYARSVIERLAPIRNPVTIYHGIAPQFRLGNAAATSPAWLPSGEYLLYVSRFDVYKHQLEVVQAYAALPEFLRKRFSLLLIGECKSPSAERVRQFISEHHLDGRVLIHGAVPYEEIPAAYQRATLSIFASSCENCPNILLEALAAGRPILSSNIMPMPEFGKDAVDYFSPFDPSNIRASLEAALTTPGRLGQLADSAKRRSEAFNWTTTAQQTWNEILSLHAR